MWLGVLINTAGLGLSLFLHFRHIGEEYGHQVLINVGRASAIVSCSVQVIHVTPKRGRALEQ
jgi:hypothetical protein